MFSTSENIPESISEALERCQASFSGLCIQEFLTSISLCIDNAVLGLDSGEDGQMIDNETSEDEIDWDWDDEENKLEPMVIDRPMAVEMMRSDLRMAKAAGYKVGCLGTLSGAVIVSLSCRIGKLWISNDAMQAWDVRPADYLVLLIRYPQGYCQLNEILNPGSRNTDLVQMRVGLCDSYKPSLVSALHAFIGKAGTSGSNPEDAPVMRPMFTGESMNGLLNSRFISLVKYRYEYGFSWAGAEKYFNDSQGKMQDTTGPGDSTYNISENWVSSTPRFLAADHLTDPMSSSRVSFPLLAIQYTLRRFAKCSSFCLNCHCKVDEGFEAIKPYVCSNELCLYQYMHLGMGPKIEWEIRSKAYVVDLLISFAYARASSGHLTDFPSGIGIKIPRLFGGDHLLHDISYKATLDTSNKTILVKDCPDLQTGDWILIGACASDLKSREQCRLHCRVKDTSYKPLIHLDHPIHQVPPGTKTDVFSGVGKDVQFVVYDGNFDHLKVSVAKSEAITMLLDTLPSVEEMASFVDSRLDGNTVTLLSAWKERISPSALDLLRWIVASNRSCIIYDDDPEHQVTGMKGYLQFRLAQGAPDKERRFLGAVNATCTRLGLTYPTLFAWHGSGLQNWHSILREGLHFKAIAHGRAYGHGVYMSRHFSTSIGYTGFTHATGMLVSNGYWRNSLLNIQAAVSLNEVVNAPEEFVNSVTCYVVKNLDWIQPRYLFVKCGNSTVTANRSGKTPSNIVPQEERHVAYGPDGETIQIPISAVSIRRIQNEPVNEPHQCKTISKILNKGNPKRSAKKRKTSKADALPDAIDLTVTETIPQTVKPGDDDDDDTASVATLAEDRAFLQPDDNTETTEAEKAKSREDEYLTKTDFRPGTLKESALKLLGAPEYATPIATKTIQRRLQEVLRVQDREPLHELGWYIDKELINNMYQWIVELHSFDPKLPLAKDMKKHRLTSIVLELRFPPDFPLSPPFVRVIRPRFLSFRQGGGGHVTVGGAMCMELLTNTGWSPVSSIESVLLQVRMAIMNTEPQPARLDGSGKGEYSVGEAIEAYVRVCNLHGWKVPEDIRKIEW